MMDFNTPQDSNTQFVYTLPYTPTEALVEITRFGKEPIPQALAEQRLREYLNNQSIAYEITGTETGCIPMSNTDFDLQPTEGVTLIGSRSGAIKPSTGYAFRNMFQQAETLAKRVLEIAPPSTEKTIHHSTAHQASKSDSIHTVPLRGTSRFAFYDSLLLKILDQQPHWGKPIFEQLFQRTPVHTVLKFLDEKSTVQQEFHLLRKLPFSPFLRVLFQHPVVSALIRPIVLTLLTLSMWLLNQQPEIQQYWGFAGIALGLLTIGIPHGAVDHLLESKQWNQRITPSFIINYLSISMGFALFWLFFPNIALVLFIAYSAWHFGQADGEIWNLSPIASMAWGTSVLLYLLGTHTSETASIVQEISTIEFSWMIHPAWILPWMLWSIATKRWAVTLTVAWLFLASQIPLLLAFGIYFIGQHSYNGWNKIKAHLQVSNRRLWKQALPFHAGAWALFALLYVGWPTLTQYTGNWMNLNVMQAEINNPPAAWSLFFIFIACISLPHTWAMHKLYQHKE